MSDAPNSIMLAMTLASRAIQTPDERAVRHIALAEHGGLLAA
jgi:hypothetical protein